MIPLVAHFRIRDQRNRSFGLWVPLVLVWFLLAPFALLVLPVFFVVCGLAEVNAWQTLLTSWQVLAGFKSAHIEVVHEQRSIFIHTF